MTVATCPGAISASKPGSPELEQQRNRGPGASARHQEQQVVGCALRQQRGSRRRRRLETGREEHDLAVRVLARNPRGVERARDGPHVAAGRLRLLERARLALRCVDRHAQHVAVGDEYDLLVQRELDRLVDVLLGTDADRATGPRHQLDVRRDRLAQPRGRDRPLVAAADVHHLDRRRQWQRADALEPFGSGGHVTSVCLPWQ